MSSVAVVILNYNGKELLKKFLTGVIQNSPGASIVVADNNSNDGSKEWLAIAHPDVTVISIASNLGFCGGYNYALNQLESDYFVLLNSDVEVTPNWLEPLLKLIEQDQSIAAAQPKVLSYSEKEKFEHAGAAGGFIDVLGYPFCRGRIFEKIETDTGQYDDVIPIFWATGACMIVRSSLFKTYGGFDETFFAHMEEIDLCWRLKRAGYRIMYCGQSKVYHVGGGTLSQSNPRKTYYNFRNGIILLLKNLTTLSVLSKLPIRIILDWIAAFKFLFNGQGRSFLAVFEAHFYVLARILSLLRKRTGKPYTAIGIYKGSIVLDYYLLGKTKFSDLNINSPK